MFTKHEEESVRKRVCGLLVVVGGVRDKEDGRGMWKGAGQGKVGWGYL